MKKTLYTFLVWNFLLFVAGLSDIVFQYNNSDYLQKARKYGHFTGYKN